MKNPFRKRADDELVLSLLKNKGMQRGSEVATYLLLKRGLNTDQTVTLLQRMDKEDQLSLVEKDGIWWVSLRIGRAGKN